MAKGEKPARVGITQDEPTKREVLAAIFFGIRLFKNPPITPEGRESYVAESVADADALIDAFEEIA